MTMMAKKVIYNKYYFKIKEKISKIHFVEADIIYFPLHNLRIQGKKIKTKAVSLLRRLTRLL